METADFADFADSFYPYSLLNDTFIFFYYNDHCVLSPLLEIHILVPCGTLSDPILENYRLSAVVKHERAEVTGYRLMVCVMATKWVDI